MNSLRHQNYKNENTEYWDKKTLGKKKALVKYIPGL